MKKRFVTKKIKRNKFKIIFYLTIIFISFNSTLCIILNKYKTNTTFFLTNILNENLNKGSIFLEKLSAKIIEPKEIIYSSLNKIIVKDNLSVFSNLEDDDFSYENENTTYIEDPAPVIIEDPMVYIYNSHQTEEYSLAFPLDYSVKPNVMIASYIMRENLNNSGIKTIVETGNIKEYLIKNNLKYNYSYVASKFFITEALKKYSTIKYLIDIHRDSATIDKTLYEQDGKSYAKVLFVVGLEHDNYEPNLKLATELNDKLKEKYPGISRGISKKSGPNVNGIYNQDLSENAMLIEIGGVDNDIEQVNNTVNALSEILTTYIKEKENV